MEELGVDGIKGWWVVLGCVLSLTITAGVGFFSIAVLAEDVITTNGWTQKQYANGVFLWGMSAAVVSPFCGYLIDRYGPRNIMLAGIALSALCEFMLGRVDNLSVFYGILAVLAFGIMCCTYIPVATMVSHWFVEKLSIATGIAMLGIGIGGGAFPIISRSLVTRFGYETAFAYLAAMLALALIPVAILVRSPEDEAPEDAEPEEPETFDENRDVTLGQSLGTRSFWGLSLGDMLTGMVFAVFNTLLVLYLTEQTDNADFATMVFSILSIGLGFGILVFGPLGDIFNFHRVIVLCYFLPALGTALLLVSAGPAMAISFAVIAGVAGGGRSALFPVAVVNSFGGTHMAAIYGVSNMLFMIGNAIGPVIAADIYERTGDPRHIYALGAVTFLVSATLVALIRDERTPETDVH